MPFYFTYFFIPLIFLFCLPDGNLYAKERGYVQITAEKGLAGNTVYFITQDAFGYLWIATETGLSRFDGNTFKNFTVSEGLPGNDVNMLMIDKRGRIWISPFKNEICYYANGKIFNKHNSPLIRQLNIKSENKALAEDTSGSILLTDNQQAFLIDTNDKVSIFPINYAGKGFLFPRQFVGFQPMSLLHPGLSRYAIEQNAHPLLRDWYNARPAPGGTFYYAHFMQDLYLFRKDHIDTIRLPAHHTSVYLHNDSLCVINSLTGSYLYNINSKQLSDTLLKNLVVNTSFTDRDCSLWLGTNGRGLYYFPAENSYNIKRRPDNLAVHTYHFYTYNGVLLAGLNDWQIRQLDTVKKTLGHKQQIHKLNLDILRVSPGNIQTNAHHNIIEAFIGAGMMDSISGIKSFMSLGDTLITANFKGLIHRLSLKTGKLIDSLNTRVRLTGVYYKNGIYYAGTTDGLFRVNPRQPAINFDQDKRLVPGPINGIAFSRQHNLLWVSTRESGVYCLRDDRILRHFDESTGLSSNISNCLFLYEDDVYIGTVKGLNRISLKELFRINVYDRPDGLLSNDITCIYADSNYIIAGSPEGISFLNTTDQNKAYLCNIHLDEVFISGHKRDTNSVLLLNRDENNLVFKYSGISFRSMDRMKYTYRLSGLEEQWQTTDQNKLNYPALPPGKYKLELFATDRFGNNSDVSTFAFEIRKAWWMHWWVQTGGFILFSGSLALLIWWRMSHLRRKERERMELKQKISSLEQLALRSQMNPHFIFNSLNSFYQYIVSQDLSGASKFMSNFSRLIRLLFETTPKNEIELSTEIEFLSTYLEIEKVKLDHIFTYEFIIGQDLSTDDFLIPSFILQPFIENAIRHGIQNRGDKKGKIRVSIERSDGTLLIRIEDNGVGRARSGQLKQSTIRIQQSRGIALTKERIDLYNQSHRTDISFRIEDRYNNEIACGTAVIFTLPLKDIQ